jgi:hypothetical protein
MSPGVGNRDGEGILENIPIHGDAYTVDILLVKIAHKGVGPARQPAHRRLNRSSNCTGHGYRFGAAERRFQCGAQQLLDLKWRSHFVSLGDPVLEAHRTLNAALGEAMTEIRCCFKPGAVTRSDFIHAEPHKRRGSRLNPLSRGSQQMLSAYYSMYSGPAGQAQDVCQRVHGPHMSAAEKHDQASITRAWSSARSSA